MLRPPRICFFPYLLLSRTSDADLLLSIQSLLHHHPLLLQLNWPPSLSTRTTGAKAAAAPRSRRRPAQGRVRESPLPLRRPRRSLGLVGVCRLAERRRPAPRLLLCIPEHAAPPMPLLVPVRPMRTGQDCFAAEIECMLRPVLAASACSPSALHQHAPGPGAAHGERGGGGVRACTAMQQRRRSARGASGRGVRLGATVVSCGRAALAEAVLRRRADVRLGAAAAACGCASRSGRGDAQHVERAATACGVELQRCRAAVRHGAAAACGCVARGHGMAVYFC